MALNSSPPRYRHTPRHPSSRPSAASRRRVYVVYCTLARPARPLYPSPPPSPTVASHGPRLFVHNVNAPPPLAVTPLAFTAGVSNLSRVYYSRSDRSAEPPTAPRPPRRVFIIIENYKSMPSDMQRCKTLVDLERL